MGHPFGQLCAFPVPGAPPFLLPALSGHEKLKSPGVGLSTTQQQLKPSACYHHDSHAKSKPSQLQGRKLTLFQLKPGQQFTGKETLMSSRHEEE